MLDNNKDFDKEYKEFVAGEEHYELLKSFFLSEGYRRDYRTINPKYFEDSSIEDLKRKDSVSTLIYRFNLYKDIILNTKVTIFNDKSESNFGKCEFKAYVFGVVVFTASCRIEDFYDIYKLYDFINKAIEKADTVLNDKNSEFAFIANKLSYSDRLFKVEPVKFRVIEFI